MAVLVTLGLHDGHLPVLVHGQEVVPAGSGMDRVTGDPNIAVGPILEPDRCRQARGQFPVHLTLGGACANGAPGNQITQILG